MSVRLSVHYVFEDRTSKVDINFFLRKNATVPCYGQLVQLIDRIAAFQNVEISVAKAAENCLSALSAHAYILTSGRTS